MTTSPTPRDRAALAPPSVARVFSPAAFIVLSLLFTACAAAQHDEWRQHGGNAAETRYSPLDQIDAGNVARLDVAWSWEIPKTGARIETTPLIADGVLSARARSASSSPWTPPPARRSGAGTPAFRLRSAADRGPVAATSTGARHCTATRSSWAFWMGGWSH